MKQTVVEVFKRRRRSGKVEMRIRTGPSVRRMSNDDFFEVAEADVLPYQLPPRIQDMIDNAFRWRMYTRSGKYGDTTRHVYWYDPQRRGRTQCPRCHGSGYVLGRQKVLDTQKT